MAKLIPILIVICSVMLFYSGCRNVDSGASQLIPYTSDQQAVKAASAEADAVEQVIRSRETYGRDLMALVAYYKKVGDNMKLGWAEDELNRFNNEMPKYNYIIEAAIAGPNLKATQSITAANYIYEDAVKLDKKAGEFLVVRNEDLLRQALEKYNRLMQLYPTSDKISLSAFRAGAICEYFNDYSIALIYYQRAYQWNPQTPDPARFKAAFMLDKMLRYDEALELYRESLAAEKLPENYKKFISERTSALTQEKAAKPVK